jgi:hypothetical protein
MAELKQFKEKTTDERGNVNTTYFPNMFPLVVLIFLYYAYKYISSLLTKLVLDTC